MDRAEGERRGLAILHIVIVSVLLVFAIDANEIVRLVYLVIGIPVALLMAVGFSLGAGSGMASRMLASAAVAIIAVIGGFAGWPIEMAGGSLWWWALLVLALLGTVLPLGSKEASADEAHTRSMAPLADEPRSGRQLHMRELVVGAQAALAGTVVLAILMAIANAEGISGIVVYILLVPLICLIVAGAAYWRGVRWPVVVVDGPLFLFAVLAMRDEIGRPGGTERAWLLAFLCVALATGSSVIAAIRPGPAAPASLTLKE